MGCLLLYKIFRRFDTSANTNQQSGWSYVQDGGGGSQLKFTKASATPNPGKCNT